MKEEITYLFNERIGILQHEGEINAERAQRLAFNDMCEILTKDRFNKQITFNDYQKFKQHEHDLIFKTLYSWNIKPS